MPKNWKNRSGVEGFNYWPAFADMATATCMMLVIFWIAGVLELNGNKDDIKLLKQEISELKDEIARLEKLSGKEIVAENRRLLAELAKERTENEALKKRVLAAEKIRDEAVKAKNEAERREEEALAALEKLKREKPTDEPPNIVLKQDESFVFPSLQATVPVDFENRFKADKKQAVIAALNSSSNIEVIEIIGHTDNVQVGGTSNVDTNLEAVYAGTKKVGNLEFGSNCELGLGRAIAVKTMLEAFLKELDATDGLSEEGKRRIQNLTYRTYSAAQLFPTDPMKPGRDEDRRIEIRFTRLRKTSETTEVRPEPPIDRK